MILVAGSASRVGTRRTAVLPAHGHEVQLMTLRLSRAALLVTLGADAEQGVLRTTASLACARQGADRASASPLRLTPCEVSDNSLLARAPVGTVAGAS